MIRHAIPYTASPNCRCAVQECGGIIPDPVCADHGTKKEPALVWHHADSARCRQLTRDSKEHPDE